jgi:hypothetical protein
LRPASAGEVRRVLERSAPGTIGRRIARLVLLARGSEPVALAAYPGGGADPWTALKTAEIEEGVVLWSQSRRKALAGPASRVLQLAVAMAVTDAPMSVFPRLARLYVARRIDRPLPDWEGVRGPVEPATAAKEVSALAAGLRLDGESSVGAYGGAEVKAYLFERGAFQQRSHSRRYPVTLRMLLEGRPRLAPVDGMAWDAAVFQSLFCLRSGMPRKVCFESMSRIGDDGWLLSWDGRTKTRRGDRRAADPTLEPHVTAASHPVLEAIMARAAARSPSRSGLLFLGLGPEDVSEMLHRVVGPVPPGFELVAHGIRAGTDTVLKAMRVPDDIIRAFGWWARPPHTDFYYQSVVADVMLRATRVMDRVEVTPLKPGICAFVKFHGDAIPSWEATATVKELPAVRGGGGAVESGTSSDEDLRVEVMRSRPASPRAGRRRQAKVRSGGRDGGPAGVAA